MGAKRRAEFMEPLVRAGRIDGAHGAMSNCCPTPTGGQCSGAGRRFGSADQVDLGREVVHKGHSPPVLKHGNRADEGSLFLLKIEKKT
jgi:hypothetical protein